MSTTVFWLLATAIMLTWGYIKWIAEHPRPDPNYKPPPMPKTKLEVLRRLFESGKINQERFEMRLDYLLENNLENAPATSFDYRWWRIEDMLEPGSEFPIERFPD